MISDQARVDLNAAMKAGDSLRVSVLRMLISAFDYKKIELQHDLSEVEESTVVQNEAKKRREAIESYRAGGRVEQEEQEKQELEILQTYLPAQMSEEEIRAELGKMEVPSEFGQAMRVISPIFKGRADGAIVAKVVKQLLAPK